MCERPDFSSLALPLRWAYWRRVLGEIVLWVLRLRKRLCITYPTQADAPWYAFVTAYPRRPFNVYKHRFSIIQ